MSHRSRPSVLKAAASQPSAGRRRFPWLVLAILATSLLIGQDSRASSLPFRALGDDTARFTASELTGPYEIDMNQLLDVAKQSRVDLEVLDAHGWFPMDDVPYDPNTHDMFQWAEADLPTDPPTPEEKVAGESSSGGVGVGIPSPVAVGGAILGGVGLLVSILADIF